jgi:NTE family protein
MKIGLALSGGGIRGTAHLGVIKALNEFEIEPTIISGVSAGSFAGAFYAAGYSPEEAMDFVKTTRFFSIMNYAYRKPGFMNTDKFREALVKYFPDDSFSALEKELYIVATDMIAANQKVFQKGSVIDAILASCAFPLLYSPVEIDGVLYADGGIINNLPTDIITKKCDKVIAVFVNPTKTIGRGKLKSSLGVMERAYDITKVAFNSEKLKYCDWLIQPRKLADYLMFDTRVSTTEEIYRIGYEEGLFWAKIIRRDLDRKPFYSSKN